MTAAMRDFLVKFGAALAASGLMSFAGAFLGMYVINAQQTSAITSVEKELQRQDKRIETLETRTEFQGREVAKLSMLIPMVDELGKDMKKILPHILRNNGPQPSGGMQIYSLPRE